MSWNQQRNRKRERQSGNIMETMGSVRERERGCTHKHETFQDNISILKRSVCVCVCVCVYTPNGLVFYMWLWWLCAFSFFVCAYMPTFHDAAYLTQTWPEVSGCKTGSQTYRQAWVCVCVCEVTPWAAEVSVSHPQSLSWLAPVPPVSAVSPESRKYHRLEVYIKHFSECSPNLTCSFLYWHILCFNAASR